MNLRKLVVSMMQFVTSDDLQSKCVGTTDAAFVADLRTWVGSGGDDSTVHKRHKGAGGSRGGIVDLGCALGKLSEHLQLVTGSPPPPKEVEGRNKGGRLLFVNLTFDNDQ